VAKKKRAAKKKASSSKVETGTSKPTYKELAKIELLLDKGVKSFQAGRLKSSRDTLEQVLEFLAPLT